ACIASVEGPCKQGSATFPFPRLGLCPRCLAQSKASSIATPDEGAGCGRRQRGPRMERQEAQGSSHGPARPGTPTALKRLGSRNLGAKGWRIATLASGRFRKPPGASRRSIPSFEGKRKTGRRVVPGPEKHRHGTAE